MKKENLITNLPENWNMYSGNNDTCKYSINQTLSGVVVDIETAEAEFFILSHRFNVLNDSDLFEMSAEVFIDESSNEKSNVNIRASFIDGKGNWHGFSDSPSVRVRGEWTSINKTFFGKKVEKPIIELVVKGENTKVKIRNISLTKKELDVASAETVDKQFEISDSKIGNLKFGFGHSSTT